MLAVLKGSQDDKKLLFDELIEKATSEDGLDAGEVVILEALKKDLFKPKSIVLEMSAGLKGVGGVKA
jgi:hypothetical protein